VERRREKGVTEEREGGECLANNLGERMDKGKMRYFGAFAS
jgi:hypothetical protein